jgi:hypothetical protein
MLTNTFDTSVNNYWKGAGYVFGLKFVFEADGQQMFEANSNEKIDSVNAP